MLIYISHNLFFYGWSSRSSIMNKVTKNKSWTFQSIFVWTNADGIAHGMRFLPTTSLKHVIPPLQVRWPSAKCLLRCGSMVTWHFSTKCVKGKSTHWNFYMWFFFLNQHATWHACETYQQLFDILVMGLIWNLKNQFLCDLRFWAYISNAVLVHDVIFWVPYQFT